MNQDNVNCSRLLNEGALTRAEILHPRQPKVTSSRACAHNEGFSGGTDSELCAPCLGGQDAREGRALVPGDSRLVKKGLI